jgi:hypothetical protein
MVIKSATVQMRRKTIRTLEEFYFSKEPRLQSHLQACPNELDKQEFLRASSAVNSNVSQGSANSNVYYVKTGHKEKTAEWLVCNLVRMRLQMAMC